MTTISFFFFSFFLINDGANRAAEDGTFFWFSYAIRKKHKGQWLWERCSDILSFFLFVFLRTRQFCFGYLSFGCTLCAYLAFVLFFDLVIEA